MEKVWEVIGKEMSAQLHHEYTSRDSVRGELYMMRILPCETNKEFEYVSKAKMDEICGHNGLDCQACLDEYLDLEVQDAERA
jgi:hypothetical protein